MWFTGIWKVFEHGTLHGEFVEVCIQEGEDPLGSLCAGFGHVPGEKFQGVRKYLGGNNYVKESWGM